MTDLSIIPFGGVRENGKNMYAVTVDDEIYILDAGLKYPETDLLGVDLVVPDITYLEAHADQIVGIFLTHGHADAIGALPFLLKEIKVPVFGSEFTLALAKQNVDRRKDLQGFDDYHIVKSDSKVDFGDVKVSFFQTTHSVPESLGIVLETKYGQVVYTGDFKFDNTAQGVYKTDFSRLTSIGDKGVLAALVDANGVEVPTASVNETAIDEYIFQMFHENRGKRIIVAAVASNIQRIQEVINSAHQTGRKVALSGKDLEATVNLAIEMGKVTLPADKKDVFTSINNIRSIEDGKLVILEAGKMGEPIRNLRRMANGDDRFVQIGENDLIFIATTPSVAAEGIMAKVRDLLFRRGADVITLKEHIRSSGHASQSDFQLMLNLLKPKFLFPVSAEYRVMSAADYLGQEMGIPKENIFLSMKGDQYKYHTEDGEFHLEDSFEITDSMIDGSGTTDIGDVVLRDRQILSEDGVVIAAATIDRKKKQVVAAPRITTRGFIYVQNDRELINEISRATVDQIEKYLNNAKDFDWNDMKNGVREVLSTMIAAETGRHPVVMPIVMEVNQNRRTPGKSTTNGKKSSDNSAENKKEDTRPQKTENNNRPSRNKKPSRPRTFRPKKSTSSDAPKTDTPVDNA
ncbi:MAG: ribonuclease J [Lactobacillaceae bacterium]|jgi:ribonuclease J|nr:ribonuclease J [Lactobacillaceae bacterium]